MKPFIAAVMIFVFSATCQTAFSDEVPTLGWKDLVPADLASVDLFKGLDEEQRGAASWSITLFENLPERTAETEEIYEMVEKVVAELAAAGIDINDIIEKRKVLHTAVVEELNGQKIHLPGYLLPLEMTESNVTEFLLVPYLGACIHVPPPPPNQIVHVTINEKKGYKSKGLFEPVMVTGVISIQSVVKDLFLVDGSSDISIGYVMQAWDIKPYEK